MRDTHVSSYKTAQKAGTPVRETKIWKWGTHTSLPTRPHRGLVRRWETQKCESEGHTRLSLQDRTKGWYAGERHKNVKMRDTHVFPYKTAQKAGTPVRDTKNMKMRDSHVSPYKTAQRAGTPVRDTKIWKWGTHTSLPTRLHKALVRRWETQNEGHTRLSLQDRTKGWYAGERHKMRDTHVSPYKMAQRAGMPVRDTKWGTHMSLPTRPHKGLVCRWETQNEGHTRLSLQDRTKGWYAGERHKMRDTHVSPYKTAQRDGTPVRDIQIYEIGHTAT